MSAPRFDRWHAAEEIRIPQRQPAKRLEMLDKKRAKHDAGGNGILSQKHFTLPAQEVVPEQDQSQSAHDHEGQPPGHLV